MMKMNEIFGVISMALKSILNVSFSFVAKANTYVIAIVCMIVIGSAVCVSCDDDITPDYIHSDGLNDDGNRPDGKSIDYVGNDTELPDSIVGLPDNGKNPGLVEFDDNDSTDADTTDDGTSGTGSDKGGSILVEY